MNRRGLYVPGPAPWLAVLEKLPVGTFLDGEHLGDRFHVFDVLQVGTDDLRAQGYAARVAALHSAFLAVDAHAASAISLVPVAAGEQAKRALLARVERAGGEGVVFRHRDSLYTPGRSSEARKHKFLESVSCLVSGLNDGRRSVRVALALDSGWREVGSVTVPPNQPLPAVGDVVEVRYMHLFEGGALYQPVYLSARNDLGAEDCTLSQVKRIKPKSAGVDSDAAAAAAATAPFALNLE
jgi:bifunctional non-homologous end joining protein LigD